MSSTSLSPLLAGQFHELFREVIRAKQRVLAPGFAAEGGGAREAASPAVVWQELVNLLERQALAARAGGGDLAGELYRQAQFVMAALADEVFLNLDWPGREEWRSNLLEAKFFGSHRAGDLFFARLDDLLARRGAVYTDLAHIYLLALALGFEGKYRGEPGAEAALTAYRQRLFRFVFHRDPQLAEETIVPQAYAVTLEEGSGRRLPYLKPWVLFGVAVVVVWVAVSFPLWWYLTADVDEILRRIL